MNMSCPACISRDSSLESCLEVWIDVHHAEKLSQTFPLGFLRRRVFARFFPAWKQNDTGHYW